MLLNSAFFDTKLDAKKTPHVDRSSERYVRSFQISVNGIRYRGHDISVGGLSFFMTWGGATFARGQVLTAIVYTNIAGLFETASISIQIASFRLDKQTGERIYGCSFKNTSGISIINMIISGINPRVLELEKARKASEISKELKHVLASGNFTFLIDLVDELSTCSVDETTTDEEFRVNSAMSLAHIKQCLSNLSSATA